MANLLIREEGKCRQFRDALEELPVGGGARINLQEWLAVLPEAEQQHAAGCAECRVALEEFAETRNALAGMELPEAGPWFTARVMAAINAKENEDEAQDGVWISVRRLAPRLAAFSTLLLILGGTWALELRRAEPLGADRRNVDAVFDSTVTPGWYDDGIGTTSEVRP
jgi:anti-sigma factor RsiW